MDWSDEMWGKHTASRAASAERKIRKRAKKTDSKPELGAKAVGKKKSIKARRDKSSTVTASLDKLKLPVNLHLVSPVTRNQNTLTSTAGLCDGRF